MSSSLTRRSTLGTISSSDVNARASFAGSSGRFGGASLGGVSEVKPSQRYSLASFAKRSSSISRPMSLGGSGSRASLAASGGRPSSAGGAQMKDPRPLNEKSHIQSSIKNLIRYLSEHGYEYALNPKNLLAPSMRDFQQIFLFLVRQMDPAFEFGAKFEDDVISCFKRLGYPFSISKRILQSVGAQHTWPQMLAAISWLIELLEYEEEVAQRPEEDFEDNGERIFFDYLDRAYQNFLAGADEFADLDAELAGCFEYKNEKIREEIDRLNQVNGEMKVQLEEMRNCPSLIVPLEQKKKEMVQDIEKFKKLIDQLTEYKNQVATKIFERKQELQARDVELQESQTLHEELLFTLSRQEITPEEAERLYRERNRLEELLSSQKSQRSDVEQCIWEKEEEYGKLLKEIERLAFEYNSIACKIQIAPASARNAGGRDFEMRIDRNVPIHSSLLNLDVRGVLRPKIAAVKEMFVEEARADHMRGIEQDETLAEIEDHVIETRNELDSLSRELRSIDEMFRARKEEFDSSLHESQDSMQRLEHELRSLRASSKLSDEETRIQVDDLERERDELREAIEAEKNEVRNLLIPRLGNLTDQKIYFSEELSKIEGLLERAFEDSSV